MELRSKLAFLLGMPPRFMRVDFNNYTCENKEANRLRGLSFIRSNIIQYVTVYYNNPNAIFETDNYALNEYLVMIELESKSLEEMYRDICNEIFELLDKVFKDLEIDKEFKSIFLQDTEKLEFQKMNWELNSTQYKIFYNNITPSELNNLMLTGNTKGGMTLEISDSTVYVDCNNFNVGIIYSVLSKINFIGKNEIRLYVDGINNDEWKCLSELIPNSILIEVDNILDYKSQVDLVITSDIATMSGSKYLMSSDSDFSILQDMGDLKIIYNRSCTSSRYISRLGDNGISIETLNKNDSFDELYSKLYMNRLSSKYHYEIDSSIREKVPNMNECFNVDKIVISKGGKI